MLDGRASPVVKVVRQAATTDFKEHGLFSGEVFVLKDVHHVEHVVFKGLGVGHHAFEEELLSISVAVLNHVVETVGGID